MSSWVERVHDDYPMVVAKSTYAWDAYTGDAQDKARSAADSMASDTAASTTTQIPSWQMDAEGVGLVSSTITGANDTLGTYLFRRAQGESADNFKERARISRYPMFFNTLVSSFDGSIAAVADQAERAYADAFGSPDDTDSEMGLFLSNVDGNGMPLESWMDEAAVSLIVDHHLWYGVLPPPVPTEMPKLVMFDPRDVINWRIEHGRVVECVVKEAVDTRASLRDEYDPVKTFVYFNLDGYKRYAVNDDGDAQLLAEKSGLWEYPFFTDTSRSVRRLPIRRTSLPLRFHVGYRVAQDNIAVYNQLSDIRNLLRVANHPKLRGANMEMSEFEKTLDQMRMGSNVLMGDWDFVSPNPECARIAYDILKEEVRSLFISWFQMYNDAPKEMTATQAAIDDERGRTSFLSLLSNTLDDVEGDVLFLFSQIMAPNNPQVWRDSYVQRSKHFKPVSPLELAEKQLNLMNGWSSLGYGREVQLEQAGFSEDDIQEIIKRDAETFGDNVAEL